MAHADSPPQQFQILIFGGGYALSALMINLRDYQADMIAAVSKALRRVRKVLLQSPTGSGKTALATHMAASCAARGWRVAFICHRRELVAQTSATFTRYVLPHGIVSAGYKIDAAQLVQVCSIDTLRNRLHVLPPFDLVIWDECHHMAAASWRDTQAHYSGARHVGLTATPWRADGSGLADFFDDLVLGPAVSWLIEQGHLSEYRAYCPGSPDMSRVGKPRGDYSSTKTAEIMDRPHLTGDAIAQWLKRAAGLRTVAFGVNVAHSQHIAAQYCHAGIPAAHLDAGTPKAERAQIIRDYADGHLLVLSNVNLFGEGFDLSAIAQRDVTIDCVQQLRPTASLSLHLQQIGRGLRPSPGKTGIILDHAGNIGRHGLPDDDREWTLEGREKGRRGKDGDAGPPPPITCSGCFGQIRRPAPAVCPYCGHAITPEREREIVVADGELEEVAEAAQRSQRRREQGQARTLEQLVELGKKWGYSNPVGWAFRVYSARQNKPERFT